MLYLPPLLTEKLIFPLTGTKTKTKIRKVPVMGGDITIIFDNDFYFLSALGLTNYECEVRYQHHDTPHIVPSQSLLIYSIQSSIRLVNQTKI
jgi:hypothetical protein